ncbi:MAG TPA: hypothetical protein VMH22_01510 [bacterium]|nr:hypothetical protein [bacterium]
MLRTKHVFANARRPWVSVLLIAVAGCLSQAAAVTIVPLGIERLSNGNTLIADGRTFLVTDARALEVDSLGRLVWAYLNCDVPFLHTARRLPNGHTLMSSSGGNKVIEVNWAGNRMWTDSVGLEYPNEAYRLDNGHTLITDRNHNRVLEVDPSRFVVWQCTNLSSPHNGNRLANGHTLVCNGHSNQVLEVDSADSTVWQYSNGLDWARCAQRLPNNNTLITDSYHNRVIEVTYAGDIVWSANLDTGSTPFAAHRLADGNTLISVIGSVIELDSACDTVWKYPNTVPLVVETLQVVNPSSGCTLYVHIHRPAYAGSGHRVPGVIFAPGGTGSGSAIDSNGTSDDIASDGFAFMHFDPDGRGKSSAYPENYDGYINQDGMHVCESLLASRDYVDTSRLGVYTTGYGITMGSGMIKRYAEPHIKFLLDFEGPADRSQTCLDSGGFVPVPADSEAFWQEREAARFMKQVPCAYLRMQPAVDSLKRMKKNQHCIQLVDSATAVADGGAGISPWTRVNDSAMNQPNRVYSIPNPPAWIPEIEELQNNVRIILYLHELAGDMPPQPGIAAERRDIVPAASLRVAPRPCRGILQVGLPPVTGARELRVHDVCGRMVLQRTVPAGRASVSLDLRGLRPAVYYVSVAGAGTVPVVVVR